MTPSRCLALCGLGKSLAIALAVVATANLASARDAAFPAVAPLSQSRGACPAAYSGAKDRPGPDAVAALSAQSDLVDFLATYHVKGRVLAVAIDLSKPAATLDLVADNSGDITFIRSSVPKTFEGVPTEVTASKPYDRFLPYMLRVRGLSRAPNPPLPARCPPIKDSDSRPDLDVVRAMAARIDFQAAEQNWFPPGDSAVIEGVAIDLEGKTSALDVTVDDGTDKGVKELAYVKSRIPDSFEGVPVEASVIETVDLTGGGHYFTGGGHYAYSSNAPITEPETLRAMKALKDFCATPVIRSLVSNKIIDSVGLASGLPVGLSIEVSVNDRGDSKGVDNMRLVERQVSGSFEGFPVAINATGVTN
ncbi:MAG TPA: hypothetical protein VMV27_17985 [Candidatus Binataceae bacterium]|nr:hypothetical protein [Candidatus Binataceae bacterium]